MKRSLIFFLIFCAIISALLIGASVYGKVNAPQAAKLTDQSSIEARLEAQKKAEEMLRSMGIEPTEMPDISDSASIELTKSEQALIFLSKNASFFLIAGADLAIAVFIVIYLKILKHKLTFLKKLKSKSSENNVTGILFAFVILFLNLSLATNSFLTASNMLNVLQQVSLNFVLAIGMTFVIISGGIDLSVGSTVCLSALTAGIMMNFWGFSVPVTILLTLLLSIFIGFANGLVIAHLKLPPFITTLGAMSIVRGIAYTATRGATLSYFPQGFTMISGRIGGIPLIAIVIMIVVFVIAWYILRYTPFGRYVFAIGGNETCAALSGINIKKSKILVYSISGFCAGIAGILMASRLNSVTPTSADGYELDAISAAVIGGISMSGGSGSITGTLLGVFIIAFISNGLNLMGVEQGPQKVVKGIIIVIAVIIDVMRRRMAEESEKISE